MFHVGEGRFYRRYIQANDFWDSNALFLQKTRYGLLMKSKSVLILVVVLLLLFPASCLAFQEHGPIEGLYMHQLAHICFGSSMFWLFFMIFKGAFWQRIWWRSIAVGALVLAFWNVMTFVGHMFRNYSIYKCPGEQFVAHSAGFWLWYLTKFDTVICCVAIFFFYMGLRRLNQSISEEKFQQDNSL